MATSQNGWPVNPARRARTVPGTSVKISVADGPAGDVLMYVASQFDRRVEDIDNARGGLDDWGWADRPIRGSNETSNHASATAIDLNATRHPLGKRGTFTARQVDTIHAILAEVGHVVRWGGDYSGRVDEMHFEINAGYGAVKRVADRLGGRGGGGTPQGGTLSKAIVLEALDDYFGKRRHEPRQAGDQPDITLRGGVLDTHRFVVELKGQVAAIDRKLATVVDELTRERAARGNPAYKATAGEYAVNADHYSYQAMRRLDELAETLAEVRALAERVAEQERAE